jgi:CHAD domain-containing protein
VSGADPLAIVIGGTPGAAPAEPASSVAAEPPAPPAPEPPPQPERSVAMRPGAPHPARSGSPRPRRGSVARSVKLAAPPNFRLLDLGAIADDVVVTAGSERQLATTYVDTADLRLVRWGATLRHRAGEGWLLRLPDPDQNGHSPEHLPHQRDHRFEGSPSQVPPEAVDLLTAYARTASLIPVARLRTVRRTLVLRTHDGARLAEIDDDEVSVLDGRRVAARFREVEVELDEAAPAKLLDGILDRLHAAGAGVIDPTPKLVHALGARALESPEIVVDDISRDAPASEAVRRAIASGVVKLLRHDAGVRQGGDPEDVHQARVATRRLRSDLRTFSPLLEPGFVEELRGELRWLAAELGAVRDSEVLLERLTTAVDALPDSDRRAGRRLLGSLEEQLEQARAVLMRGVRDRRYLTLLDRLVSAAQQPEATPEAEQPAADVLPALAAGPWKKLLKAVRALPDEPADDELHDIRIRAKRARYAAEAVAPVVGRRATAFARAAANLQTILGDFHDAVVAQQWLREHGGRGAGAFAAGQVFAAEGALAQRGRDDWQAAWKEVRRRGKAAWR